MTSHYATCLQSIPGRDASAPAVPARIAWLRRYLAERAAFSWTTAYQERAAELAKLEAEARS